MTSGVSRCPASRAGLMPSDAVLVGYARNPKRPRCRWRTVVNASHVTVAERQCCAVTVGGVAHHANAVATGRLDALAAVVTPRAKRAGARGVPAGPGGYQSWPGGGG